MNKPLIVSACLLALVIASSVASVMAQDDAEAPRPTEPAAPTPEAAAPPTANPERDPTIASDRLRAALNAAGAGGDKASRAVRIEAPTIQLRALIVVKDKPPVGLIQVDEQFYTVKAGEEVVLSGSQTLTVQRVDRDGITIRDDRLNKTLLIR